MANVIRIYTDRRYPMGITRDELKKKRLQAMGVVGDSMQASADMYDRVIGAGQKVKDAISVAETAQMAAIDAQVADLNEMADDVAEFGQAAANPTTGAKPAPATAPPSTATTKPGAASAALQALLDTQPNPPKLDPAAKGDAYFGTHGEMQRIDASEVGDVTDVLKS